MVETASRYIEVTSAETYIYLEELILAISLIVFYIEVCESYIMNMLKEFLIFIKMQVFVRL